MVLVFVFLRMLRILTTLLLLLTFLTSWGQNEARLPADLRQHNLTTYNSSLFNPAFSLDRNNPQSLAFWVRWQWQGIDANPTTLFLNYTRKLNDRSAAGIGFFQQNTGVFFDTGGVLNYAYRLELSPIIKLTVGANLFGFKQTLADDRFQFDPNLPLPLPTTVDDFILQMAPGVSLSVERLTLSLASENLLDYNFTAKEGNTSKEDKIFMALFSYDFPLPISSVSNAFLRPSMYLRTIPGQANQVGFYGLLNTNKYWGQFGYNNFYGYGVGGGGTFLKRLSIGALVEFGTGASINQKTSFELMAAYFFGTPDERHKIVGFDLDEKETMLLVLEEERNEQKKIDEEVAKAEELAAEEQQKKSEKELREKEKIAKDSLQRVKKEEALAVKKRQEQLAETKKRKTAEALDKKQEEERQRKLDSVETVRKAEAVAELEIIRQQRIQDSLAQVKIEKTRQEAKEKAEEEAKKKAEDERVAPKEETDKPQENEKYEEVKTEDGLQPGYYLIANVFGTKKYFDAFMADLQTKGLQPKSFLRSKNNFNYAYLERFETMGEARRARDTNYDGKYSGKTWIFRVVGE